MCDKTIFEGGKDKKRIREIMLMNSMYKMYASMQQKYLEEVLDEKRLIPDCQAKFRRGIRGQCVHLKLTCAKKKGKVAKIRKNTNTICEILDSRIRESDTHIHTVGRNKKRRDKNRIKRVIQFKNKIGEW